MRHLNLRIYGVVQGVCFRKYTWQQAFKHSIRGYIMNKSDGTVYIEAEGDDPDVDIFVAWCRHGPSLAKVDKCEISEGQMQNFDKFEIKY
ncbi:MAG: acylphosphatase, acylphosphatase [Candidatus Peregrinibacteria bacterium GW2011_GWF2_33_10]|nr:MAG: acylphosphatase, acylphosphatase [Candidatus Peregrinibacteria bacterium GW2011_GWF2_33_10]OGJ46084.1 MAG: hypothetical protein A2263_00440 [Candidatus Peregrinibacteria bacterium RIFOXYA2_FULL_33_21]OGJ46897.1 MAG: hypothetical protein A2272_06805 [Candidatus Peregrinibacteria bacterium RIFOXYA12_FULL_33_12]OGJ51761.1 MAG: hypothetical protein A2307_05875 [Candidatus Peregrinibacteria bacterium RIFOXYB2_FULL_33_20]